MAVFSYDNYVDDSTIANSSPVTSPLESSESISVQKLKTRQLGDVFRQSILLSQSPSPQLIVDFDLGSAKPTRLMCILNHDMAGLAYTINFGTSAGASDVGQETGTFFTGITDEAPNDMLYFASAYTAQHVRLIVTVTSVRTVEIGRVWMDDGWSLGGGLSFDFAVGVEDLSPTTETPSGGFWASSKKRRRVLHCKAHGLTTAHVVGTDADTDSFLSIDIAVGTSGEVVLLPLTDTQRNKQRLGVYGHISRNEPIQFIDKNNTDYLTSKRLTIKEDR